MTIIVIMSMELHDIASISSIIAKQSGKAVYYAAHWSDVLHKCNQTQYCAELAAGTRQFAWQFIA